ncbi:MAG TPA: hypothetical protein VMF91_06825 [Bryobacteraceae bacterium]|nr:hypothetical protein [Bryobacteraceae bacterium]
MNSESAGVLAAQVVNYLKGEDIECIIASSPEPIKSQICQVKDRIAECARNAMTLHKSVRKVIVATLRIKAVLNFRLMGDAYLESDEKKRIESMLSIYGPEFPGAVDPKMYLTVSRRFRDANFTTV